MGNTQEAEASLLEYWNILKRRRVLFVIPAIGIALVTAFYVLSMPAIYRSEATILIEDQEIPEDIVGATITNYASQQIQLISQRLITLKNINYVVDKIDVYQKKDSINDIPPAALAKRFRKDMELDMVSAETLNQRGQEVEIAVAFTLAFKSLDPVIAQKVTQELLELFLAENQRSGVSRTSGVLELLASAVNDANEELLSADAVIADFKVKHEGALPELYLLNLNVIDRAEQQLSDVSLRLQQLEQRKLQLSTQLAPLSPSAPVTLPSGETVMSDRDRLRALLMDFRRKSSIYQTDHPDIVKLEREIESLRRTVGDTGGYELLQKQLRQERENLEVLRDRYSDAHPDVKNSEAAIAEIESQLVATNPASLSQVEVADNPAYVLINTQLQSTDLEIKSLLQKRNELRATVAEHEALMRQAPRVEVQYEALLRTYENAKTKHSDLQKKMRAAEVAADVEQRITGQRFVLIEPPPLPIDPEPRNRSAIVMLGLLLAAGIGAGCVVLAELLDQSIRGPKVLAIIAGSPPLAVIPYLNNSEDVTSARTRRAFAITSFLAGTALSIVYVIYFLWPF
jgi:uncharacterized protein involved in exopolysaccharide biosynthesis